MNGIKFQIEDMLPSSMFGWVVNILESGNSGIGTGLAMIMYPEFASDMELKSGDIFESTYYRIQNMEVPVNFISISDRELADVISDEEKEYIMRSNDVKGGNIRNMLCDFNYIELSNIRKVENENT